MDSSLSGKYDLDHNHSSIGFVARHAMVTKVRGTFNEVTGSGHLDAEDPSKSNVSLVIKAASIDTRNEQRDAHLRGNDFFDMETYPEITFASTSISPAGDDHFTVIGDLTMKGATNPVTIDFEFTGAATDPFGNQRIGLEGTAVINRKDWGITWNAALEAGGMLVSDKVTLELEVSAIKTA